VAVTAQQIGSYAPTVPLYRAVGKGFLMAPRDEIEGHLEKEAEKLSKNQKDLEGRKEYLERRIASNRSNMADITSSATPQTA
jgi:chaperonin cofactor prefoldin